MAFFRENMSGNLGAGGGTSLYTYKTGDLRADIEAAGYFNDAYLTVNVGDSILINSGDALFQVIIEAVDTSAKTVVVRTTQSEGGA